MALVLEALAPGAQALPAPPAPPAQALRQALMGQAHLLTDLDPGLMLGPLLGLSLDRAAQAVQEQGLPVLTVVVVVATAVQPAAKDLWRHAAIRRERILAFWA